MCLINIYLLPAYQQHFFNVHIVWFNFLSLKMLQNTEKYLMMSYYVCNYYIIDLSILKSSLVSAYQTRSIYRELLLSYVATSHATYTQKYVRSLYCNVYVRFSVAYITRTYEYLLWEKTETYCNIAKEIIQQLPLWPQYTVSNNPVLWFIEINIQCINECYQFFSII